MRRRSRRRRREGRKEAAAPAPATAGASDSGRRQRAQQPCLGLRARGGERGVQHCTVERCHQRSRRRQHGIVLDQDQLRHH
jgi:hypothetical protein